jgi:hypothetical protein
MAVMGETEAAHRMPADIAGAVHWFALVAALVVGGLFLAARAGDAYTHVAGLLFAGFGLLFGGRLLHRLLP